MEENDLNPIYVSRDIKNLPTWLDGYRLASVDIDAAPNDWFLTLLNDQLVLNHPNKPMFNLSTSSVTRRIKSGQSTELLKACDIRAGKRVLDGFGGWGVDGLTMALRDAQVTICEQAPLVHMMQLDLARRLAFPAEHVLDELGRFLTSTASQFDVVYLDPMFPLHPKGAKPRRDMEVLAELALPGNVALIFDNAMKIATERVVVKHRLKDIDSSLPSPNWTIKGRTVRFDVYTVSDRFARVGVE